MRILLAVSAGLMCAAACPLVEAHGLVLAQDPGTAAAALAARETAAPATVTGLTPGSRIRIRLLQPYSQRVVGEVLAVDDTTLRLRPLDRSQPRAVALSSIRQLEVSAGRSKAHTGAKVGAIIFGVAGGLAGMFYGSMVNLDCESNCGPPIGVGLMGVTLGSLVGAVLGGGWDSGVESEQWRRVPITRPTAAPLPVQGPAMRVSWTIRF